MDRDELYRVTTLFLVSMLVLNADFAGTAFPASLFSTLAQAVSFAVMVLAPSYILADAIAVVQTRLGS